MGEALFHDPRLSGNRQQSCASCHARERAFTDPRVGLTTGATSLGADGQSLGRRNAPTLTYVALVPAFSVDSDGYRGGLFHDGRAATLVAQASGPLHAPREMGLPDPAALVARLREEPAYVAAIERLNPELTPTDDAAVYASALAAIVAFERSQQFSTFDSKYDRFLSGRYEMTTDEAMGREIFFSSLANCRHCHLQDPEHRNPREPFSNHRYFNIGVPANEQLAAAFGEAWTTDLGLAEHLPDVPASQRGRFRVPTLRNVAVTAPYMHNGVFQKLETAVRFYSRYVVSNAFSQTNPETGAPWGAPMVKDTIALELLADGQPMGPDRLRQLVAFLRTLTDARYEPLLTAAESTPTLGPVP
ncbi:MAG: cytochrome c peroxidase [Pseudomonadota bacterium]